MTVHSVAGLKFVGLPRGTMMRRRAITAGLFRATLVLCAIFCASLLAKSASGQIAKVVNDDGRQFFGNAEPRLRAKLSAAKPRTNIYLPAESSLKRCSLP